MLQLVAYLPNEVRRFPISGRLLVLGSSTECDIRLPFPGVADRHAELRRADNGVVIERLADDAPLSVNGEPAVRAELEVLDEINVGRLTLLLEDRGSALDLEATPGRRSVESQPVGIGSPESAKPPPEPTGRLLLERLSRLSDWVLSDDGSSDSLESIVRGLLGDFGGGVCFLLQGDGGDRVVRLAVATEPSWLTSGEALQAEVEPHIHPNRSIGHVEAELDGRSAWASYRSSGVLGRRYLCLFAFARRPADSWSPDVGLAVAADLMVLGLVHHVGRYEPILPGHAGRRGLSLAPGLVLGPAAASELLVERLKACADADQHVVLVGEDGSGREQVAATLHRSSRRHVGPFAVVSCSGAETKALEADLFGAEIRGRSTTVRREGKMQLASGGTLYIDAVDELPLDLQARLLRVLRTGEVEGPATGESTTVDARIICSTRIPLARMVASGQFRADLAHRLAEVTIHVPPLRERLEDLTMLVQAAVNRFTHDTGKRVRGITMQALNALAAYPFPGNVRELENAVRQMVLLAPDDGPMDVNQLPAEIRHAPVSPEMRTDIETDLELAALVAGVERAAISEALRRASGNKSRAARLLGVSRNGLARKMARHGI